MTRHYYFKFGEGNSLLGKPQEGEEVELSIYFNKEHEGWKVSQFLTNETFDEEGFREMAIGKNLSETDVGQAIEFILSSLPNRRSESWLWIFAHPKVYAFRPISSVFDGVPNEKIVNGQQPKSVWAICERVFSIDETPEFFAAINANQAYNRRTIRALKSAEHKVAQYLLRRKSKDEKLAIETLDQRFDFLSPVQFETLIFLIFHHAGAFCSTYRGGTRKDIDLKIQFLETSGMPFFDSGKTYFLQIKKKPDSVAWSPQNEADFLIWLGEPEEPEKRKLGKNWLEEQIKKYPPVEEWLSCSLDFIELSSAKP